MNNHSISLRALAIAVVTLLFVSCDNPAVEVTSSVDMTIHLSTIMSGFVPFKSSNLDMYSSSDGDAKVRVTCLNSNKTPKECDWFDLNRSIKASDLKRDANYYTVGFPAGEMLATALNSEKYEPTSGILHLVHSPSKYTLFFKGDDSIGGQSGSPIYDKRHRLVGVLYGGFKITVSTNACPIIHAQNLVYDETIWSIERAIHGINPDELQKSLDVVMQSYKDKVEATETRVADLEKKVKDNQEALKEADKLLAKAKEIVNGIPNKMVQKQTDNNKSEQKGTKRRLINS